MVNAISKWAQEAQVRYKKTVKSGNIFKISGEGKESKGQINSQKQLKCSV